MPIPYFANIPGLLYDMLGSGNLTACVNIMQRVGIKDTIKNMKVEMYKWTVPRGDRITDVADKYYGWSGYHWVIMLANDIVDPYLDWVMTDDELASFIRKQYGTPQKDGLLYAYQTTHHYEDFRGNPIDYATFLETPENERRRVTVWEYWNERNDSLANIYLIDKKYLSQIEEELYNLMNTNPLR